MQVNHDEAAVADAASRLQLRKPNAAALDAVAQATAASPGTTSKLCARWPPASGRPTSPPD